MRTLAKSLDIPTPSISVNRGVTKDSGAACRARASADLLKGAGAATANQKLSLSAARRAGLSAPSCSNASKRVSRSVARSTRPHRSTRSSMPVEQRRHTREAIVRIVHVKPDRGEALSICLSNKIGIQSIDLQPNDATQLTCRTVAGAKSLRTYLERRKSQRQNMSELP